MERIEIDCKNIKYPGCIDRKNLKCPECGEELSLIRTITGCMTYNIKDNDFIGNFNNAIMSIDADSYLVVCQNENCSYKMNVAVELDWRNSPVKIIRPGTNEYQMLQAKKM